MTIISYISAFLFIVWLVTGLKKNTDFLSPARIFGLIWTLALFLVEFKFSRFQLNWNLFGWFVLLLGVVTFLLGNYTSFVLNSNKKYLAPSEIRKIFMSFELNEKRMFKLIILFFFIYSISFIAEIIIEGYLPLFSSRPDRARVEFGVFGLHLFVGGVNTILFLIAEYLIFVKQKKTQKVFLIFIFIIAAGSYFTLLQRYNFFVLSMMILCLIYYSKKKISIKTYLISFTVIIGFIIGIQSLRLAQLAQSFVYSVSEMKFPIKYAAYTEPYMYIVMNLENFIYAFPKITTHSYGFFSFDFLMALTGLKHALSQYAGLDKFPYYIAGYNTFPFYWSYYYDYGLIGLALVPFIIGYAISEIFYLLHRNPTLISLSLYCIAFSVIAVSIISDPLTRLDMVFNYVAIVAVQVLILKRDTEKLKN